MTKDTERALAAIQPMAKELGIEVDASDLCLYCNGQAIGIAYNSTYATVKEFLGYALYWTSKKDARYTISKEFEEEIKRYWVTNQTVEV